jgi:hypothetical protein
MIPRASRPLVLGLALAGCFAPSASEIERTMEDWLGGDVPSDFRVLASDNAFSPGDNLNTVRIDYSPESYAAFLDAIDPAYADTLRSGRQVDLTRDLEEGGWDFFLLTLEDSRQQILRIQYGNE